MNVRTLIENFKKSECRMPRVGFFGFGICNRALYKTLASCGVIEFTLRADTECGYPPFAECFFGENSACDINEDILFVSPSVRREDCPAVFEAMQRGVTVSSDCELFFNTSEIPSICITGSDGKSTVTALTAHILRNAGISAYPAGNFGVPFCELEDNAEICVAELSSFNLSYLSPPSMRAAITNITENHLNWHRSFDEYRMAKSRVLDKTEGAVLSASDPCCLEIARHKGAFVLFSADHDFTELSRLAEAEHYINYRGGYIILDGEPFIPFKTEKAAVRHRLLNTLTAVGLTLGFADKGSLISALDSFHGLPHRAELCHTARGIDFIDSSIDTTPLRTANTLCGLNRPVLLLLGGRGKGLSYEPLSEPILRYARVIAIYGEAGEEIENFLISHTELRKIPRARYSDFDSALKYLCDTAHSSDTVLLSPAATAYGEFPDFTARGVHFKEYVKNKFT